MLELKRWLVFIFIILPLTPLILACFFLGAAWSVVKVSFSEGSSVLGVWGGESEKEGS